MSFPLDRCGAVIIAGGKSIRMGKCKALLEIQGETMLSRLTRQLSQFSEVILSANDPALAKGLPVRYIPDIYKGAGPAAGLHAALSATYNDALFCVPCDMPYFDPKLIDILLNSFSFPLNGVICQDGSGHLHPLCGVYSKKVLPLLQKQLEDQEYRMSSIVKELNCCILNTSNILPDKVFFFFFIQEEFHNVVTDKEFFRE